MKKLKNNGFTLIELLLSLAVMSIVSVTILKGLYPVIHRKMIEWQVEDYLQDLKDDSKIQVQTLLSQCDNGIKNNDLPIYSGNDFSNAIVVGDTANVPNKNLIDGLRTVFVNYKTENDAKYNSEDFSNNLKVVPTSVMVTLDFARIEHTSLTLNQFARIGRDLGAIKIEKGVNNVLATFSYPILSHRTVGSETPLAFCVKNPYKAIH